VIYSTDPGTAREVFTCYKEVITLDKGQFPDLPAAVLSSLILDVCNQATM
jgi:hypothetical protein